MKTINSLLIFFSVFAFSLNAAANIVFIGIMENKKVESVSITVEAGNYEVLTNGKKVLEFEQGEEIIVLTYKNQLKLIAADTIISKSFVIKIKTRHENNFFSLRLLNMGKVKHRYEGDLLVTSNNNKLKLINIINVENYLKGVMRAEIGKMSQPEFLKAMATVSRTYTMRNMYRHAKDGFDLCDAVHCQVYYGERDINDHIRKAIKESRNKVIYDKDGKLVNAVFHSNSGGHTVGSEDVWSGKFHYLPAKPDPYSTAGSQYSWRKEIPLDKFKNYLEGKTGQEVTQVDLCKDYVRQKYYYCNNTAIPLKEIRQDWKLRSTYFVMEEDGDALVLHGRGYGHGVGLSQEGANRMAQLGKNFEDIIKFYYEGVGIRDYKSWKSLARQF